MIFNKTAIVSLLILVAFSSLNASSFSKKATVSPVLVNHGEDKNTCVTCGMSLKMFYKTSHIATFADGTKRQYCSIACLSSDMSKENIIAIDVVDAQTQKVINAKTAHYVINSDVRGTMAKRSKLAFASQKDASSFIAEHGGKLINFEQALKAAQSSKMMMKK